MKQVLNMVRSFFTIIRDIFPYILILYLILFLLENLFTGFVSNNIDLNNVLVVVLFLGFLSVFAPIQEQKEEPHQKNDLYLIVGLVIAAFFILFFKMKDPGIEEFIIAFGSGILVAILSAIVLYSSDIEQEEQFGEELKMKEKNTVRAIYWSRHFLPKYFIVVILLCIGSIIGLFIFIFNTKNVAIKNIEKPTPTIIPYIEEVEQIIKPDPETLRKIPIEILNGSPQVGSASAMGKFLQEKGFNVTKSSDADSSDYQNLYVLFRPEEYEVVKYLITIVQGIYPNIIREPLATDSAKIILILGKP